MIFAVGAVVHLVVLLLPLYGLGTLSSVEDPATLVFLTGATALYLGDARTMRWTASMPHSPRSPRNRLAVKWASVTGGLLLLLFWSSLAERSLLTPERSAWQIVGGVLLLSGVTLRALAVATLKHRFRTEIDREDGDLVRHGIYRFLRHPSESGLLSASLGAVMLLQSTLGLTLWCAALVPATLVRLVLEERALEARFGERYRRYVHEVGGLLPLPTLARASASRIPP